MCILTDFYFLSSLSTAAPEHLFLQDLREKSEAFDNAAKKYTAKTTA